MTIRFITSWNGYSAGDRATLSAAIEASLISGGIARADYVQDNPSPLYPPNANDAAAVVGAAGGLVRRNTIAFVGDSQTANGVFTSSTATTYNDDGWTTWFLGFASGAFTPLGWVAAGGRQVNEMRANLSAAIALNPGWVAVMGGINDVLNGRTYADITADLDAIYSALSASGIKTIACLIYPLGSGHAGFTAANNNLIVAVNKWISAYCAEHDNIVLADTYAALIDVTATSPAALAARLKTDNLHTSANGARAAGLAVWNAVSSMVRDASYHVTSQSDRYDYSTANTQLIANPLMQGSEAATAPVTGNDATGVVTELTGTITGAASVVARSDGVGNNQRLTLTSATSGASAQIRNASVTSRVSPGQTLRGEAFVSATGMTGVSTIYVELQVTVSGTTYSVRTHNESNTTYDNSDLPEVVMRTPELIVPPGTVTFAAMFTRIEFSGSGGAVLNSGRNSLIVLP